MVYDIEHQVLVCLDQQVIILKNQLEIHEKQCSLCKDVKPIDVFVTQSLDMETDNPIQGLKWKLGTMCTHCKAICNKVQWKNHKPCQKLGFEKADISYQEIRGRKNRRPVNRGFGVQTPVPPTFTVKCSNEASFNYINSSASQHPAYLRNEQLQFNDFDSTTRVSLIDPIRTPTEELLEYFCNIYFLSGYLDLSTSSYLQFRQQLRQTEDGMPFNDPFDSLTDIDAVKRYMHGFADLVMLLLRNRRYHIKHGKSPLGLAASKLLKDLSILIHCRPDYLTDAKNLRERMLRNVTEYKIPDLHNRQRNHNFYHDGEICDTVTKLQLVDSVLQRNYNFKVPDEFENPMRMIHALWLSLILQPTKQERPMLYSTIGFYLGTSSRGSPLLPNQAEYAVSGLLYSMRLVVWQEIVKGGTYTSAFHVWKYGLLNISKESPIWLIHKLAHDVHQARNDQFTYSCCWADMFKRDTIVFLGQSLHLQRIFNGFDEWIADTHFVLRGLLFDLNFSQDFSDAIGNTIPEYTFFEDENLLFNFIRDEGHLHTSTKSMNKAINIVLRHPERANKFPELMQYCEQADAFLQNLLILTRLTMVGSPRSSEVRTWTYRNSQTVRSFGISQDLGFIFSEYQKNKYVQDNGAQSRVFGRSQYLPWIITQFISYYFSLVRPMVINIVGQVLEKTVSKHMRYKMCCNESSFWPSDLLLKRHPLLTEKYFGTPIFFKDWRHIIELIYAELPNSAGLFEARVRDNFSSSMGHSSYTAASSYATNPYRRRDVTAPQSEVDRALAVFYHNYLQLDKIGDKYKCFYSPVRKTYNSVVKDSPYIYHVLNKSLTITNDLSPDLYDKLRQGFQSFIDSKVHRESSSEDTEMDMLLYCFANDPDFDDPSPPPSLSQDSIIYCDDFDSPMEFENRSKTMMRQLNMSVCAFSGTKSFIGIMPTQSGKTMVYELPIFLEKDTGTHSIVVVSSNTMRFKLKRNLEKSIKVAPDNCYNDEYSMFVITPAELDLIYEQAKYWKACNTLKRIVFDDSHTLIKDSKWKLDPHCKLFSLGCQVIFLSSIMPRCYESIFSSACRTPLAVFRTFTDRPNIQYRVFKSKNKWNLIFALQQIIRDYLQNSQSDKILICIPLEKYKEEVINLMPSDIKFNYNAIIATPDDLVYSQNITYCIHWRYFKTMFEFEKALSFTGKKQQVVKSFCLFYDVDLDPTANLEVPYEMYDDLDSAILYLTGDTCRREVRNQFIDSTNLTCRSLRGFQYCDVCRFAPTDLDNKISLATSHTVQYDVMLELIRRRVLAQGQYCLLAGRHDPSSNGCQSTKTTFKKFPWKSNICKSCGLTLTFLNGQCTHDRWCKYSHCMQEAVSLAYLKLMDPSGLNKYMLQPNLISSINQSVRDVMKGERMDQLTFGKLKSCEHVKIVAAAIKIIYRTMFDQNVHWNK